MKLLNKIHFNSPVIIIYTIICIFSFVLNVITNNNSNILFFSVYRGSFFDPLNYIRLISHIFGHIDFSHLFNNIVFILLLGPLLEEKHGSKSLSLMIFFTAFVTGIFNNIFFNHILLGSSGIVFMMIVLSSFVNIEKGKIPLTAILIIGIFFIQEVVYGATRDTQISHITHIVGGACGAFIGFLKASLKINDLKAYKNI